DEIGHAQEKGAMRALAMRGPPYSESEKRSLLEYCEDDVNKLARLIPHIVPTIRSLPHAMFRAKNQWAVAQQERRGVPVNLPLVARARRNWQGMRRGLVDELDRPFGCYEIGADGVPHWRRELFTDYLRRNGMLNHWGRLESGQLAEDD